MCVIPASLLKINIPEELRLSMLKMTMPIVEKRLTRGIFPVRKRVLEIRHSAKEHLKYPYMITEKDKRRKQMKFLKV